jgi:hypothetical protein
MKESKEGFTLIKQAVGFHSEVYARMRLDTDGAELLESEVSESRVPPRFW